MQELGLTDEALGLRLGYANPAKAAGRVYALCNDRPFSAKSRFALWRLPDVLELLTTTPTPPSHQSGTTWVLFWEALTDQGLEIELVSPNSLIWLGGSKIPPK